MIFRRFSPEELRRDFTHYARFAGIVPCYFHEDDFTLVSANWVPEFALTFAVWLFGFVITTRDLVSDEYDCEWPIELRGKIPPIWVGPEGETRASAAALLREPEVRKTIEDFNKHLGGGSP